MGEAIWKIVSTLRILKKYRKEIHCIVSDVPDHVKRFSIEVLFHPESVVTSIV